MAPVGLLAAAGCAAVVGVRETLDWPVLFPILSLSLLPLYLGAKLFGVLSLWSYRLGQGVHRPYAGRAQLVCVKMLKSGIYSNAIYFFPKMLFFLFFMI